MTPAVAHRLRITAQAEHIDMLGHVNNAVWVGWLQDVSTSHWIAEADAEWQARFIWVVVRHEVDYLRPLREGETVDALTWLPDPPRGATFARIVEFVGTDDSSAPGTVYCRGRTLWAMLDAQSLRPQRIPRAMIDRFAIG